MYGARHPTAHILIATVMMSKRHGESEVDRVAGLACFVCAETQPAFYQKQRVGDAWLSLVRCMSYVARGQLFFLFPAKGDGKWEWMPSWPQLLKEVDLLVYEFGPRSSFDQDLWGTGCPALNSEEGERPYQGTWFSRQHLTITQRYKQNLDDKDSYRSFVVFLPSCVINGFDNSVSTKSKVSRRKCRKGTVTLQVRPGVEETFNLTAYHPHVIPSGRTYCLISHVGIYMPDATCYYWVVGYMDEEERFHKVSVLQVDDDEYPNVQQEAPEAKTDNGGTDVMIRSALNLPGCEDKELGGDEETSIWLRWVKLA